MRGLYLGAWPPKASAELRVASIRITGEMRTLPQCCRTKPAGQDFQEFSSGLESIASVLSPFLTRYGGPALRRNRWLSAIRWIRWLDLSSLASDSGRRGRGEPAAWATSSNAA